MESGWNVWVWLLGVVVRRYIDFLILLIPTPLVSVLFAAASLLFVHFNNIGGRGCVCTNSLSRLHLRVARLYLHCGISHWADI